MFSSLPDYRRFSEKVLPRLRKDFEQKKTNRLRGMVLNLALLAGLWGLPLYARWIVLTDLNSTPYLPEAVLGEWRRDESTTVLEFTRRGELRLTRNQVVVESADYRIVGDELEVSGFREQPDDRLLPVNQQRYQIAVRGDRLFIKPATTGFTSVPRRRDEGSSLRFVLPPWSGSTVKFQRGEDF